MMTEERERQKRRERRKRSPPEAKHFDQRSRLHLSKEPADTESKWKKRW